MKLLSSVILPSVLVVCAVLIAQAQEFFDGQITLVLQHSLAAEPNRHFKQRALINLKSLKSRSWQIPTDTNLLSDGELRQLEELVKENGNYYVRLFVSGNEDKAVTSFIPARMLYESKLTDVINVHFDQSGNLISVSLNAGSQPHGENGDRAFSFNTSVNVRVTETGPVPDTVSFLARMERERVEKMAGEQGDNRSFLAKYWMYIVPVVLILMISSATNPEGGR